MATIRKLIVLNGSEGHKFEVGKQYANSEVRMVVNIVRLDNGVYRVCLQDNEYVDILTNNVMVFHSL